MTHTRAMPTPARLFLSFLLLWQTTAVALAGPGAHGPNGEHIDPAGGPSSSSPAQPRFEAATEIFELLAVLGGGELSLLIDRFETNVPVLNARVVIEAAGFKAEAKFHQDHGDYAIDDPAFIAALSRPGEHAVVITVVAGEDSDLLNGTLIVAAAAPGQLPGAAGHDHEHGHDHTLERVAIGAGVLAALGAVFFLVRRRRRRRNATLSTATASTAPGAFR